MEVRPGNLEVDFWKDLGFWKEIFKLVARLAMIATVVLGGTGGVETIVTTGLEKQEAKAATVDNRVVEAKRETNVAYEEWNELLRYHWAQNAACDSALESFSRHRDDERDFAHLIEECHSEGEIE